MSTTASCRDVMRLIGASAAAVLACAVRASENQLRFSAGAVVRTVLQEISPDGLAGGATLFHEHLSVCPDFMPRVMAQELRRAAQAGVSDAVVHGMLVDNPRWFLACVPRFPRSNTVGPS